MVCAESSASFSKTAAALMSSLGEATERVTSMIVLVQSGCGPLARLCKSGRSCPFGGGSTGRPAAAQRQPHALASGGTARLTQRSPGAQKWRQLRVKQPSARKLGSVARGPSAHRPGAATPPAQEPKNAPECKVQ